MSIIPWRSRRKLLYSGGFTLAVLFFLGGITWLIWPSPTCFDGRMNGEEEGVDCSGPCTPCLKEIRDISVLWTRFFKGKEGVYDIASLIENPNVVAGLPLIRYQFKLYDANNIVMAIREGGTFINPGEQKIIFETGVTIGQRAPKYVYLEFEKEKKWKYIQKEKFPLSTVKKDFVNFPTPRITALIRNESLFDVRDVFVSAVLYDEFGNVQGVSSTKIDLISPEEDEPAFFTWSVPFEKEPATIEIFATTNLTAGQ